MLVGADDRPIHKVRRPIQMASRIALLLQPRQEVIPDACVDPAVKLRSHRLPRAIALRQVTPGNARGVQPQNTINQTAAVVWRKPPFGLGQQRFHSRPLLVGQFMSMSHPFSLSH